MYIRFGEEFDIYRWHVIEDYQYGPGWFLDPEQRARFDIFEVKPSGKPACGPLQKVVRNGFAETPNGWVENWVVVDKTSQELAEEAHALEELKVSLMKQVDDKIAGIYNEWLRFDIEYYTREQKAKEYVDANYEGEVSVWISSYADAVQLPYDEAADSILQTGAHVRNVMEQLAVQRMRRYVIKRATSVHEANTEYSNIMMQVLQIASAL